uniref:Dihydromonacolin L monooxygenase mokC n=1 Tax=Monascus pilosus TaxID=89488 RepID=MOKC_MONPI|nr:RecName: Full=Dihydromonacolin L monooxygenase mokC; AltName: Full=Cytochrome P450 monooxygenase mokC; AltName: Full=Dihydromonacolin L hydroxylase; AltName: Full=Monacolin K biosynthesis protein C; AltName: Full=Monacolin L hydroxylase [Monascus pilosus]ABA02241.1 P450 monooxygenase [Monascus pilosus]
MTVPTDTVSRRLQSLAWSDIKQHAPWLPSSRTLVSGFLCLILLQILYSRGRKSDLRVYNPKKWWELTTMRAKREFDANAPAWIEAWFSKNDQPLRFIVDSGYCTILPSSMADEFRKMKELCMYKFLGTDFHSHLPGFDGFKEVTRDAHLITKVVMNQFQTQAAKYTKPLADEASATIADIFGDNKEWHTAPVYNECLDLVTRTVTFIMVGDKLAHNEEWLDIAKHHAVTMAIQARQLRLWPVILRPIVHWLEPQGAKLRAQVRRARQLLEPIIQERRAEKAKCLAQGIEPPRYVDSIQWFEDTAKGQWYDAAGAQLAMDFAGIYGTSDLMIGGLVDIVRHPHLIEPLRNEIRTVIGEEGWTPASLYKLKLLDSCLKESQRVKPVECATMRSYALQNVTFSNGTFVPKGELVAVAADRMSNPEVWPEPKKYDPYRYMRLREDPDKAFSAQLENTNGNHIGFGWHPRACPGRFFASKEIKIMLAFLLIRYDWKLVPNEPLQYYRHSFSVRIHPATKLMMRRRDEDL